MIRHIVSSVVCLVALVSGCSRDASPPASPATPAGAHDDHTGHGPHAAAATVVFSTGELAPTAGEPITLRFHLEEAGQAVTALEPTHEKLMHVILVRDALDEFLHVHPDVGADGTAKVDVVLPKAGVYQVYVDYKSAGRQPATAQASLSTRDAVSSQPNLQVNAPGKVTTNELVAQIAVAPAASGAGQRITFQLLDPASGAPISDLEPYLGAMGHLVVINSADYKYAHAHPLDEAQAAPGIVEFEAHLSESGIYKGWGQFQRGGRVLTVPFIIEQDDHSAPQSDHEHGSAAHGMAHGPDMRMGMGMGMGMGPGMKDHSGMSAMRQDAMGLHALLNSRDKIRRQVLLLPNGVETITESDDPAVAKSIRDHVAAMYKRLEANDPLPMMSHDPLFAAIFKSAGSIRLTMEETPLGLKVTETSEDLYTVKLIQSHAALVDAFIANGIEELHREHGLPTSDTASEAAR